MMQDPHFLEQFDLMPLLIHMIPPEDLPNFVLSSDIASKAFNSLSEQDLDRYCEVWIDPFPSNPCNEHFLKDACTCIAMLAILHGPDMSASRFMSNGRGFSDAFWSDHDELKRSIERAVRLKVWCRDRHGCSAREFFTICMASYRAKSHAIGVPWISYTPAIVTSLMRYVPRALLHTGRQRQSSERRSDSPR